MDAPSQPKVLLSPHPRLLGWQEHERLLLLLLGCPLVLLGSCLFHAAATSDASAAVAPWVCSLIGFTAAGPGVVLLLVAGLAHWRARGARQKLGELFEGPWTVDRWSPPRARDLLGAAWVTPLVCGVMSLALLGPFTYVTFEQGSDRLYALLADLIPLGLFGLAGYRFGRAFKYRGGSLSYSGFPLPTSAPIALTYTPPRALRGAGAGVLRCALRCVAQEITVNRERGGKRLVSEELSCEARSFRLSALEETLELEFVLPPGALGTELQGEAIRFYELEVSAEVEGIDYRAVYLLPVYVV